jgi:uncharacterized membrane protein
MKNIMIKVIVVLLALSVYFNVSQLLEMKTLNERNTTLQESITQLENLQENEDDTDENSCNKLYEITVQFVSEDDDFDQSITVCTNKVYLGDALDEISDEIQLEYDPNYNKEYIYGRMIVSAYGIDKEYEEYFAITINSVYSNFGLDLIEIEDDNSYEFTLVRWS